MRIARLALCMTLAPSLAVAQHCALPAGSQEESLTLPPVINPLAPPAGLPPKVTIDSDATRPTGPATGLPSDDLPILNRLRQSGSVVEPLGIEHGMGSYIAHSPGHFMVFDVTPDHQAILSGLEMKVPLNKLVSLSKDRIQELSTAHGLRTFFLRTGERFQVFYATPDEQIVIPGVMWDGSGKNITRLQIAKIPGTKPEVQIEAPPAGASTSEQADKAGVSPLDMMQVVYAGTYGRVGAPHAWMLVDPQCSFSVRALDALRPFVTAGALQLSIVPLSILDAEDHGLSTQHAIAMVKLQPDQMVAAWSGNSLDMPDTAVSDDEAKVRLVRNMQTAAAISLRGTPTFIWRNRDGSVGRLDGVPQDVGGLIRSIGS